MPHQYIDYSDATISAIASQNINDLRHWPLCGEFTAEFPLTKGQ